VLRKLKIKAALCGAPLRRLIVQSTAERVNLIELIENWLIAAVEGGRWQGDALPTLMRDVEASRSAAA
jgi:hypothetical protein